VRIAQLPSNAEEAIVLLKQIIGSPIPIILWLRRKRLDGEDQTRDPITHLITEGGLLDLPEAVRSEREEAVGAEDHHHGNHISLVWDDPNRVPKLPPELREGCRTLLRRHS
jgi:hypothetical protein